MTKPNPGLQAHLARTAVVKTVIGDCRSISKALELSGALVLRGRPHNIFGAIAWEAHRATRTGLCYYHFALLGPLPEN